MCTVLLPPGGYPIVVNKYISYHIKSSRMRWVGHVAPMGEGRGAHRVLVGKPEGKRLL